MFILYSPVLCLRIKAWYYRPLWYQRHEGGTWISQCTRRVTMSECTDVPSSPECLWSQSRHVCHFIIITILGSVRPLLPENINRIEVHIKNDAHVSCYVMFCCCLLLVIYTHRLQGYSITTLTITWLLKCQCSNNVTFILPSCWFLSKIKLYTRLKIKNKILW